MDEEYKTLQQLVASNAKAIEALTNALSEQKEAFATELAKERAQMYQFMADSLRQFLDLGRRIDNNTADIRELAIENQRILRYLESIVNRSGDAS